MGTRQARRDTVWAVGCSLEATCSRVSSMSLMSSCICARLSFNTIHCIANFAARARSSVHDSLSLALEVLLSLLAFLKACVGKEGSIVQLWERRPSSLAVQSGSLLHQRGFAQVLFTRADTTRQLRSRVAWSAACSAMRLICPCKHSLVEICRLRAAPRRFFGVRSERASERAIEFFRRQSNLEIILLIAILR